MEGSDIHTAQHFDHPFKIKFEIDPTFHTWHWLDNRTMVVARQTCLSRWKHNVVSHLGQYIPIACGEGYIS